jgi:hypothetical protein
MASMCTTIGSTIFPAAIMAHPVGRFSLFARTARPASGRWSRCTGALFPIGATTRRAASAPLMQWPRPFTRGRCFATLMPAGVASCLLTAFSKDGLPFGLAGLWENWKNPAGEWVRTFAIIVTDANELVGQLHDRMPVILHRADYERWLSAESDPRDLLRPFESEAMRIWPVSTRVNKPENDDPSILDEVVAEATEAV